MLLDAEGNQNVERLDLPAVEDIRFVPARGGRPPSIPTNERIRGFTAPVVGQELTDALVAAEEIAKAERRAIAVAREKQLADLQAELEAARSKREPEPPRVPGPSSVDKDAGDDADTPTKGGSKKDGGDEGSWIVAENRDGLTFGAESPVEPKAKLKKRGLVSGDTGLPVLVEWVRTSELAGWADKNKPPPTGGDDGGDEHDDPKGPPTPRLNSSDDARVLPLLKNSMGEHHRDWRDIAMAMEEVEIESWAIAGPRVTSWAVRFLRRRAMPPTDHHRWWCQICDLLPTDWGVAEHGSCLWIIELMGSYDQFDLPNCASCEALFRRVMAIEWQYRERVKDGSRGSVSASPTVSGSAPLTADEFDLFEGAGKVQATLLVAPQLIAYISEETKKEADITKASRKAREERLMARTGLSATDVGKLLADEAAKGATGMEGQEQGPRRRSRRTKK